MMEVNDNVTKGNDRFYGYCIDLLKEIVNNSDYKFDYTLRLVDDHLYGHKNEKNEWTGMIGQLVQKVGVSIAAKRGWERARFMTQVTLLAES